MDLSLTDTAFGRYLLPMNDLISDAIRRGEGWDSDLLPIVARSENGNRVAIDAGANIGFFSIQISKYFKYVFSFEPQKIIYYNLCANLLLNNCFNVRAFNLALYKGPARLSLAPRHLQDMEIPIQNDRIDYERFGNFGAVAFDSAPGPEQIDAVSIDSFHDLDIGFIKSDCQGLDFPILLGASQTISRCQPVVIFKSNINLEQGRGIQRSDYPAFFSQFDYRLLITRGGSSEKQAEYVAIPRELVDRFVDYQGEVILA
jgi:FkbM family methyltransferase